MARDKQDDLTADDRRVEPTDNGLRPDDPPEDQQPPQDPAWLPEGTATEADR
jgi:hypothetical protein